MSKQKSVIAGITLNLDKPTELTFEALFHWTIWQFPRKKSGGLIGAIRPPVEELGWLPVIVHMKSQLVHVLSDQHFDTPEEAAAFAESE